MNKIWIVGISIVLFSIITLFYWLLTKGYGEKVYGKKMWKNWVTRTFYWQGALLFSGALTLMIIYLLKSTSVLTL